MERDISSVSELKQKFLIHSLWLGILAVGILGVHHLVQENTLPFVMTVIFVSTFAVSLVLLKVNNDLNWATNFCCISIAILHPIDVYINGGINSISFYWFFIALPFMSFLLNRKHERTITISYLGFMIFCGTLAHFFPQWSHLRERSGPELWLSFILIAVSMLVILKNYHSLNTQLLRLEANEKFKSKNLVALLCHDIANSLNLIDGHTDLDLREDLGTEVCLDRIQKAAQNAIEIIDSVRIQEAVNEGKAHIELVPVPTSKVLEESIFTLQDKIEKKSIKLRIRGNKDLIVETDRSILTNNVINNLLSNSIKFSEQNGNIDIEISPDEDKVVIKIKDYGIGIPKDILDNIFRIDVPTSRPGTLGEAGTGFGMLLVKSCLEKIKGEIEIKSFDKTSNPSNHGTEYIVKLKRTAIH